MFFLVLVVWVLIGIWGLYSLLCIAFPLKPFKARSSAASLVLAVTLAAPAVAMEAPEGVVYCGGDPEQQIEFVIRPYTGEQWNASMTIDGQRVRAMSSYSYFGRQKEPDGFVVILLAENGNDYLVFEAGGEHWLEMEQTRFDQCN